MNFNKSSEIPWFQATGLAAHPKRLLGYLHTPQNSLVHHLGILLHHSYSFQIRPFSLLPQHPELLQKPVLAFQLEVPVMLPQYISEIHGLQHFVLTLSVVVRFHTRGAEARVGK